LRVFFVLFATSARAGEKNKNKNENEKTNSNHIHPEIWTSGLSWASSINHRQAAQGMEATSRFVVGNHSELRSCVGRI
jgi:hypothetical protein